ncbi:glycoside hydrolase family 76 protein [Amycolatopsis magusensis]|uniref:glycoside hydrolase family 76 protein n=1 Tax=Amycolatopsis magusensis TaxID=882444 RepID=UPI0037975589
MSRSLPGAVVSAAALLILVPVPAQAEPTAQAAPAAVICNQHCEPRDPALAPQPRQSVTANLAGRRYTLYFDDSTAMGWAAVSAGAAGDEVWLDRSFDGGSTWASGSRLGATKTPAGATGWRTLMYNVDDWANRGVGALRACGKPAGQTGVTCTAWARTTWNAWDRRTAAATALMQFYDNGTGLFRTTGWWNAANALNGIIDGIRVSGMTSYQYAIANTYDRNRSAHDGEFRNEYLDDTGWWGLAWVAAYDLTGDSRYLTTARIDAEHMAAYWDGVCGGGVWWRTDRPVKNAITNSLYIQLNAALHNRIPGDTVFRQRASAGWAWFGASGMINSSNLVNDGLTSTCVNDGKPVWSYNQGVLVAGLTELNRATGDPALLTRARQLANASTTDGTLNPGGILRDPCEPASCAADGPSFKGAYTRGLGKLNNALPDRPYTTYLRRQADSAYAHNRTALDTYGLRWAGPFDVADAARQHSVVDLLNATP